MTRALPILLVPAVALAAAVAAADPSGYLKPEGDPKTLAKAARHFREGVRYLEKGAPAPALRVFRRAAKLCPDFFEARYNVAKLEGQERGRDKGIAELEAINRDFPANVRAFNDLGQLLVETEPEAAARAFETAVTNGEKLLTDEAFKAAGQDTLAQLAVDLAFAYHNRGASRLAAGKLDEAEADFTRSIELNDANFFSHYGLGLALLQQGEYAAAKASFKRAKALKRSFPGCSIGLARAYLTETPPKPSFALAELKEAEALTGQTAEIEELYGDAYRLQANLDTALQRYEKALELGADPASIAFKRGLVAREQGDTETADKQFRECVKKTTEPTLQARAYTELGGLAEIEGDFRTAANYFGVAIASDPEAHAARLHLGLCLYRLGNQEQAEEYLAAAVAHYGDDPPEAAAEDVRLARKLLDKIRADRHNQTQTD